ncbi:F0F1 ATP synthase subunit B [bacterium AH-315-C07]|nr:F0F1 ATP synthase subunit B [bacterium AH-315-C07]
MSLITPDIGLLFWMLISFSISLIILKKFAWKPIMDSLKNRENTIEEALKAASKAKEEMEKLGADNEKLLKEARNEREMLMKEANETKNQIIKEAKDKAKEEGDKMIENAKNAIDAEKRAALKDVKHHVSQISIEIAEKILRKKLENEKEHQEFMDNLVKEINFN